MADQTVQFFDPQGTLRDVPSAQVDKALSSGGQKAVLFNAPNGKQHWVPQNKIQDALDNGGYVADPSALTIHTGEGTYKMKNSSGSIVPVPYSMVRSASRLGLTMDPSDRLTYVRDAAADPKLKNLKPAPGVAVIGRNTAGQPIYGNDAPPKRGFWGSTLDAVKAGAAGFGQFLDPRETPEEKERNAKSGTAGYLFDNAIPGMYMLERLAEGQLGEAQKAKESFHGGKNIPGETPLNQAEGTVAHGMAALLPGVGPWAAQTGEKMGEQFVEGNLKGAAGTFAGNAILYVAPHLKAPAGALLAKSMESLPESVRTGIRTTLGVTDKQEDLIEKFAKESDEVRKKNEDLTEKNKQEKIAALKKRQDEEAAHQTERDAVKQHNDAVMRDRNKRVTTQKKLDTASQELDQKIDTAQKKAKAENDAAWGAWRDKVANVQVDMDPVVAAIKAQTDKMSPEQVATFKEILRETRPAEEDLTELDRTRNSMAKNVGYDKPYADLPPDIKAVIDEQMKRIGLGEMLDEATGGGTAGGGTGLKQIPASRLHGWKTQLEDAVRADRTGNVKYAIGQVLDVVRKLEEDVSKEAGADDLLKKARALHGPYVDTFRNPLTTPRTAANYVRSKVTPAFTKDTALEDYIAKLGNYDPSIPKTVANIDNLQAGLKALPKEQPLREQVKQNPAPLEPAPKVEPEPLAEYPDGTKIPAETQRFIYRKLRQYGAVGPWVLRMLVGGTALHVLGGSVAAFGNTMLIGQTAVSILTDAMRRPSVVDWLSKPSAEQIKMIDALPPEDAARLRQALVVMASDELSRKVAKMPEHLDPSIARFLLGAGASRQVTMDDMKKRAAELQAAPQQAPTPSPAPPAQSQPAPGPESAIPLENLNKIIEQARGLRAKTGNKLPYTHVFDPKSGTIVEAA